MKFVTTAILITFFSIRLDAPAGIQDSPIFPLQEKHVHSSSIVECPNGDFLVCWFHGSGERKADDVVIQGARLRKGSNKWSPVFLMADTPDFPDCNPVLFIDRRGRLWLFWIAVRANGWEHSILKYRLSSDYQRDGAPKWDWQDIILLRPGEDFAKTIEDVFKELITDEPIWAEYAPLYSTMIIEAAKDKAKRQIGWMTRTHPVVLPGGRILLPLYSDGYNVGLVAISDDDGLHWRASKPIVGLGPIQPTIVRKKSGTLVAYLRDSGGAPNRVMISSSEDGGESWSPAVDTDIPNPGSSLEAISLKDGRWVMVYNDTERGRHSIAASLSDDEGKSWKWKRHIGRSDNRTKSFAYPSLIQADDGMLHLTYSYKEKGLATIRHCRFDADRIRQ
ncbi:MAG: exo-alpha-sialidase [Sedimentisphaerales bacterium]|nr:exo-alpha-sialidase [Sedimentisphaerales bacterium]